MVTSTGYNLRNPEARDYKQLSTVHFPRPKSVRNTDNLYELKVIDDVYTSRVKVHYVGYGSEYDEWRDKADIVNLKTQPGRQTTCMKPAPPLPPDIHTYFDLAY